MVNWNEGCKQISVNQGWQKKMYQKNVMIIIWTKTNLNKFRVKVSLKKRNPKALGVENYPAKAVKPLQLRDGLQ